MLIMKQKNRVNRFLSGTSARAIKSVDHDVKMSECNDKKSSPLGGSLRAKLEEVTPATSESCHNTRHAGPGQE